MTADAPLPSSLAGDRIGFVTRQVTIRPSPASPPTLECTSQTANWVRRAHRLNIDNQNCITSTCGFAAHSRHASPKVSWSWRSSRRIMHVVQVQCSLAASQTISHNSRSSKYAAKRAKVFGSREPKDWLLTAHLVRCTQPWRRSLDRTDSGRSA